MHKQELLALLEARRVYGKAHTRVFEFTIDQLDVLITALKEYLNKPKE